MNDDTREVQVTILMPRDLHTKLKSKLVDNRKYMKDFFNEQAQKYLEEAETKTKERNKRKAS